MRWRWWTFITALRLRRLGGRLVVQASSTPRLEGPLRVETGPRPGTVTLRVGREVRIGRDCIIDLADDADGVIELGDGVLLQSRIRLQPWGGAIRIGEHTQVRDGCELKSRGSCGSARAWSARATRACIATRRSRSAITSVWAIA